MKQLFIFIILISLFITCSKEKGNTKFDNYCSPSETGPTIPPYNRVGFGYKYVNILENNSYYPCINPLNPNEFVFILSYTGRSGLYKYDIISKATTLIIKFVPNNYIAIPSTYARWGRKGWLIFTDLYSNVYKIKDNGDSLTQLTFTGSDWKPEWNIDGTMFCTEHYSNLLKKHLTIIRNELGNEIDTIPYDNIQAIGAPTTWNDKYILGTNDIGIVLYDFKNRVLKEIPTELSLAFPTWINSNEFVYSGINGIYIYNISNNKVKQIRSNPNSNRYDYVNMLPNNQMICERNYTNLIDSENAVIASKTNICLLNPCDTIVTDFDLK
jgi:hypothetical protein